MQLKVNYRRCMRAAYYVTSFSNTPVFSLYNNGSGADLLVLWYLYSYFDTANFALQYFEQAKRGSPQGTVQPLVSGDMQQAGVLYYNDDASPPTVYSFMGQGEMAGLPTISATIPIGILQPGWSAGIIPDTTSSAHVGAGFVWQACHAEDLSGKPCRICDPEFFIVTQQ